MNKLKKRALRKNRVRAKISGTAERPRLSVSISLNHIRVQLIDDLSEKTLAAASDLKLDKKITKTERAIEVGKIIAEEAKKVKIKKVVFDRGHKLYHGRVKALADSARKNGLEF